MSDTIKVGVIGLGAIAHVAELPALSEIPGVRIVAGFSRTEDKRQKAAAKFNIEKLCPSFDEFMKVDMDCAFVLTPKENHTEYVLPLLDAGKHVFLEKPLALTLGEGRRMVAKAEEKTRLFMVAFNRRYAPVYRKAKEAFAGRRLDVCVAGKGRNGSEYRATLENAIHMVDLMRFFCGEAIKVQAYSQYTDIDRENVCTAHIRFDSGAIGILVAARTAGQWYETMDLYGGGQTVRVNSPDDVTIVNPETEVKTIMTPLAMGWANVADKMGFKREVEHFIDCARTGKQPLTNGADALKTHELVDAILREAGLPGIG
ncbi:MAG: Gfo/Idh/MocA family oxidoreductase [Planctomycetota bacterium]|jgi:virulence factor|nr:Gfo/Idh/MocA family oxidoreductase [Planctomycetota bacterium]